MDNGLGLVALEDENVSNVKVLRGGSPDEDNVTFIEAFLERERLELLLLKVVIFIPIAAMLPIIGERVFKIVQFFSAKVLISRGISSIRFLSGGR